MNDSTQLTFDFDGPAQLITPDEIFDGASQPLLERFQEDRRLEWKPPGMHARELARYFSLMWANTLPEGGVIAIGVDRIGRMVGCASLSTDRLNELESTGRS